MPNKIKDNLSKFLAVKNQTEDSADLYFYGDIVSDWWGAWQDEDQYPEAVKNFLNDVKGKNLNIHVNSGGGSVFAGITIYNMLKNHKGYKTVYIDGLAASIASVIALAGDKVVMGTGTLFMIHKPWGYVSGNSDDMRAYADTLDTIQEAIMEIYKENLKDPADYETVKGMVDAETWLSGEEASKYFNIEIADTVQAVACASECFMNYSRTPKDLLDRKQDRTKEAEKDKLRMEIDLI